MEGFRAVPAAGLTYPDLGTKNCFARDSSFGFLCGCGLSVAHGGGMRGVAVEEIMLLLCFLMMLFCSERNYLLRSLLLHFFGIVNPGWTWL